MRQNPYDDRPVWGPRRMLRPALVAFALLLLALPVAAHGPPTKRDQDFRLLADHNDDCGGDSGTLPNCRGSHDLVGLDVLERNDPALGDVVAFRFILNGGSGSLRDVLTVKVDGTARTFELKTTDNAAFQGTGFDAVAAPVDLNDNGRFVVEASVKRSTLGDVGAKLTDYTVDAYAGTTRGDIMPGCYYNALGKVQDAQCSASDAENPGTGQSRTSGYVLTGPAYYTRVTVPTTATVAADGTTTLDVTVANPFRSTDQLAVLTVSGADGVSASWVDARADGARELDVFRDGEATARLALHGDGHAPGTGKLSIVVSTNLGGHSVHDLPYEVTAAAATTAPTGDKDDEGAPAQPLAMTLLVLLAVLAVRRRT